MQILFIKKTQKPTTWAVCSSLICTYNTIGSFNWNLILFSYLYITYYNLYITVAIKKRYIFGFVQWRTGLMLSLCSLKKFICSLQKRSKKNSSSKVNFAAVLQIDVPLSSKSHTLHYRLSSASSNPSDSNYVWTFRFGGEDWQVYNWRPAPAVGSPRMGPDLTLSKLWEQVSSQTSMLPGAHRHTRNFLKNQCQTWLWFQAGAQLWCTQTLSPATNAELRGERASFPAQTAIPLHKEVGTRTGAASAVQAPEGALTSRMWPPELGFCPENDDNNHVTWLAEGKNDRWAPHNRCVTLTVKGWNKGLSRPPVHRETQLIS